MIYVCDTSILVQEGVSELLNKGQIEGELIIPTAVVEVIEKSAREGETQGLIGLKELQKLSSAAAAGQIEIRFGGQKPRRLEQADVFEIARELAKAEGASLLTADKIQEKITKVEGIDVVCISSDSRPKLSFEKFFEKDTMSLHFREGIKMFCKKGRPGSVEMVTIGDKDLTREDINDLAGEIVEKAKKHSEAFIEIDRKGATVVQYDKYRIAIARPPFSDGGEITVVHPVAKLSLDDYKLDEKLIKRLEERAEGVVIAGSPGAGKSTFAQALAEFYKDKGKLVKTMENPRDLNVSQEITQYGLLEGSMENTAEILLLARPDYTVYDELRKTHDFEVFGDMRLAGVGMIGVVHASRAIDAIQRFLSRVEMGVIPQVLDTIIYIKAGKIEKVYKLGIAVKVPSGMMEADLARPVVEIRDFFTDKLEYEIYAFGEETTIVPVKGEGRQPGAFQLAAKAVENTVLRTCGATKVKAKLVDANNAIVWVDERSLPKVIGKGGKNVEGLQHKLNLKLKIEPYESLKDQPKAAEASSSIPFDTSQSRNTINFYFDNKLSGRTLQLFLNGSFLFAAAVGKKGLIKVEKHSEIGRMLMRSSKEDVEVRL